MSKASVDDLQDKLRETEQRIVELREERDEERDLVARMREYLEEHEAVTEQWIAAFDMRLDDKGNYEWTPGLAEENDRLVDEYNDLLTDYNYFLPRYLAKVLQRNVGRPLAASDAQRERVRKLHKAGSSLRDIANETNLGLQTVRTIVGQTNGTDRTAIKHLKRIKPDVAAKKLRVARMRSRKALPKRINKLLATSKALLKESRDRR